MNMLFGRDGLRASLVLAVALAAERSSHAQCLSWARDFGSAGVDGEVLAFAIFDDGHGPALYAAGNFQTAGATPASCIARWNGVAWSALGAGLGRNPGAPAAGAMAVFDDGSGPALYVGGLFDTAGGSPASNVAKWNGSTWSALGGGTSGVVNALATYDDGSGLALYAAGSFLYAGGMTQPVNNIARWNGSSWSSVGGGVDNYSPPGPWVSSLCVFDGGSGPQLYVGGTIAFAGNTTADNLASWNGSLWSGAGIGVHGYDVIDLTAFDDGAGPALYVGGDFASVGPSHLSASNVARWDGSSWAALGDGFDSTVEALTSFDDGDGLAVYAGGSFAHSGSAARYGIARWSGSGWSPLGSGAYGPPPGYPNPPIMALGVFDDSSGGGPDLYAGGLFAGVAAIPSHDIARWRGCSGSPSSFCAGDGTLADCPCSNVGLDHHGCENSASTGGARLSATGTTSPDTILLYATGELPSALTVFLQGDQILTGPLSFGDGLRCTGGHLRRLYVKTASGGSASAPGPGDPTVSARSAALGDPLVPGATRAYQTYYRDASASFCPSPQGSTWNVTNGQIIRW